MSTDDNETEEYELWTRRETLQTGGAAGAAMALPMSHSGGDSGILASVKNRLTGDPDLVVMHNGEVVTEGPKELNFEGSAIKEVTEVNDYDGLVRITLEGGSGGGAFTDTDGDGVAELQDDHTDYQGGDARNLGSVGTERLSDNVYIENFSGATLAQKLENAVATHGSARYHIPIDNDGSLWDWDKSVTISQNYIEIVGTRRVDIDYTLGSASGPLLELTGSRQHVEGLSFQAAGTQTPDYGIRLTGTGEQYVEDCFVADADIGFAAESAAFKYAFEDCRTNNCATYGFHAGTAPNGRFAGCFAKNTAGDGIHVTNSNAVIVENCSSDTNDAHALNIEGGSNGYVVQGLTVEGGQEAGTSTDALVRLADNGTWGMYAGGFLDDQANTRRGFNIVGGNHVIVNTVVFAVDGDTIRFASTGTGRLGVQHPVIRVQGFDEQNFSYVNDATDALLYIDGAIATARNLSGKTGRFTGDVQVDDGTNTAGSGLPCRWTGSAWQPFDGSATFT